MTENKVRKISFSRFEQMEQQVSAINIVLVELKIDFEKFKAKIDGELEKLSNETKESLVSLHEQLESASEMLDEIYSAYSSGNEEEDSDEEPEEEQDEVEEEDEELFFIEDVDGEEDDIDHSTDSGDGTEVETI